MHKNTLKKRIKNPMYIIIVFISIALIVCAGTIWYIFTGGFPTVKKGIESYGTFENYYGYGELSIFPDKEYVDIEDGEYYYYSRNMFMDPTCQIYLKVSYSEEAFQNEFKRLSSIQIEKEGNTHHIMKADESFNKPAYVTIYNWSSSYEYAVIDKDNNQITYVYLQGISEEKLKIPKEDRPIQYMKKENLNNYSIYVFDGSF